MGTIRWYRGGIGALLHSQVVVSSLGTGLGTGLGLVFVGHNSGSYQGTEWERATSIRKLCTVIVCNGIRSLQHTQALYSRILIEQSCRRRKQDWDW